MNGTPRANRYTIGLFGNRNAGKSSLINAITNQSLAVVSDIAGTTTDPVTKSMELLPIGPILLIDTPGLDDSGLIGKLRIEKTYESLRKCNLAIFVKDVNELFSEEEKDFLYELKNRKIPFICALNKCDNENAIEKANDICSQIKYECVNISSKSRLGIEKLKETIIKKSDYTSIEPSLMEGLVEKDDVFILVTPIDASAPKGRLILPQQQVIRAILDEGAIAIVTKETELNKTLNSLRKEPKMVITDSQAFKIVDEIVPKNIPLTSFSILFARQKGDLDELIKGVENIDCLKSGDKVLICEACTHHRQDDDIGTVKIPNWISRRTGKSIDFEWTSGAHFPKDIKKYALIIHCGGCMINRKEMLFRISEAEKNGVKITNYGMVIAYVNDIIGNNRGLGSIKLIDLN